MANQADEQNLIRRARHWLFDYAETLHDMSNNESTPAYMRSLARVEESHVRAWLAEAANV